MVADGLTKALGRQKHEKFIKLLNLINLNSLQTPINVAWDLGGYVGIGVHGVYLVAILVRKKIDSMK